MEAGALLETLGRLLPHIEESTLKLLLYILWQSGGTDRPVTASLTQLISGTGLARDSVLTAARRLENAGVLNSQRSKTGKQHEATIYLIQLPALVSWAAGQATGGVTPRRPPVHERVYRRDGRQCQYCGTTEAASYHVDHVIPVTRGGVDKVFNLVVACDACNLRKNDAVWIPRNLDLITTGYPVWRAQVITLANG